MFKSEGYVTMRAKVPRDSDLGIMVAVPLHLQAEGCSENNILTSKRERHERRRGVRE